MCLRIRSACVPLLTAVMAGLAVRLRRGPRRTPLAASVRHPRLVLLWTALAALQSPSLACRTQKLSLRTVAPAYKIRQPKLQRKESSRDNSSLRSNSSSSLVSNRGRSSDIMRNDQNHARSNRRTSYSPESQV